jgi:hypothetical protein
LLLLNGLCKLRAELHLGKRQFTNFNVELIQTFLKQVPHFGGYLITVVYQLHCGVASDDGLEDFIADGGENAAVVVHAEEAVDLRQLVRVGLDVDLHLAVHNLQVFGASAALNGARLLTHIEDNGVLKVRDLPVPAFRVHCFLETRELVELESQVAGLN